MFIPPNVSHVTCYVSRVTCQGVTCHVSHVTFFIFYFIILFWQSGEAYRWRVCYQRGLPRLVCLESQIITLSQKCQKSDFLGHCSFTQFVHDVEKLRRKPKIFVNVIQRFWYGQHKGLLLLKIRQKQPKLQLR